MSGLTYVNIPTELFVLPLKGIYEMSVIALVYNFGDKGLKLSNGKIAKALKTSSRTIERVIARLRKKGFIEDVGTGKNDRCLRLSTDTMSVVSTGIMSGVDTDIVSEEVPTSGVVTTDMTADHNKVIKVIKNKYVVPPEHFRDYWNQHGNLPRIITFTEHRKRTLAVRSKNPEFTDNWKLIIDKLSHSPFHTGTNNRKWRATVDWLLKSDNYIKILELNDPKDQDDDSAALAQQTRDVTEEEAEELLKEVTV